ncbi:Protein of unknown function [Cnuella takakiae]|uniref:DUF1064 domain-containing protein n=1 Tax=Cnuella takakiae TaxID=1302690 RepID=A0A1M4VW72_9BACT|nr:DUF1064 domain-containing protein [Cnuella takakiae]SHE73155.1 Protein of unknown function [Cnuella takakiae]
MKGKAFTLDDLKNTPCAALNQHLWGDAPKEQRKSKYGAKKVVIDGITFDSTKEGGRYLELKMLERAGLVTELELQVPYELNPGGTHSLKYIADFRYRDGMTGQLVVEDCKGYKTKEYIKKRKLMREVYGIIIKET